MTESHVVPTADVGVVIGRFQVAELHAGHRSLLDRVCDRHRKVIVLLGMSPVVHTPENPLDFESRRLMIQAEYPQINVLYVRDSHDDIVWSRRVDQQVRDLLLPTQSALLYGGRDSFIRHYAGTFATYELDSDGVYSGSAARAELGVHVPDSAEWRAGVIWASRNRYPTAYQAVDIAVLFAGEFGLVDGRDVSILLGRKPDETLWRLPGGMSDPGCMSLEEDARRELMEETGTRVQDLKYLGSYRVADWRYAGSRDCIKTVLFAGLLHHDSSQPEAADDLAEVAWHPIAKFNSEGAGILAITPDHRPLVQRALLHAASYRKDSA